MSENTEHSARLTKLLFINKIPVTNLVSEIVQLDLFSTGRASFTVVCEKEPTGIIELHIGYQVDKLIPYFLGAIESKHFSKGQWFITCRELIGALSFNYPIAIRFATLTDVLNELAKIGLEFTYPDAEYMKVPVPCFYHNGDGISTLRCLGKIFNIKDYIFQQRPDGKVFVGSWHDSAWATSEINDFSDHVLKVKNSRSGEMVIVPKLRPGLKLNGKYIVETTLAGNKQDIRWSKTPSTV
jgi:hypothetical protein